MGLEMTDLRQKCEWQKMTSNCAMSTPTIEHFIDNGVYIKSCWIPYDYENAYKVYFVSDNTGNEFGQYHELNSALSKAREMAKLDLSERRYHDL